MKHTRFNHTSLPDNVVNAIIKRDAVLWIGRGYESPAEIEAVCSLVRLPWRMVLCEDDSLDTVQALESLSQASADAFVRMRGFIHLISNNPQSLLLPPRSLPVFLLNGRPDATDPSEMPMRSGMTHLLRRLTMINMLQTAKPTSVVLLLKADATPLEALAELWADGFRSLVAIASMNEVNAQRVDAWLATPSSPIAIDFTAVPVDVLAARLLAQVQPPDDRLVVRMRTSDRQTLDLDVSDCELPEQPLLDRYTLLRAPDLHDLAPEDLTEAQFKNFFDKSMDSWEPYAASLPWERSSEPRHKLIRLLERIAREGSEHNALRFITSESGAGGTTVARSIAFAAAQKGFPTLVARSVKFRPNATEIASFLFRVRQKFEAVTSAAPETESTNPTTECYSEVPWLLVFDVAHWDGHEAELRHFLTELTRSGRPTVLLAVIGTAISDELINSSRAQQLIALNHELTDRDALDLGSHLNKFLRPFGWSKDEFEWKRFFEAHRPRMQISVASFWIALEFWLKGQLDLGESIQSWLYRQFKDTEMSDGVRCLLLEIAALSIERQPLPEPIMPSIQDEEFPLSIVLENLRASVPAFALVRDSTATTRQWAMAHDLLGRYLVTSTYFDRAMLDRLGLGHASDPVHLRLILLRRIATRAALANGFKSLALEFAVTILKLDFSGNVEFFRYWREVLATLKDMPQVLRDTSRTFNHHIAISCRRIAKLKEYFDAAVEEKRDLLTYAINRLEYAIDVLPRAPEDESDLNLFNSLSLAYQDFAELKEAMGAPEEEVRECRRKAESAARRAHDEGPSNSFVLETMARNILQNGELYDDEAVQSASDALGFIYQALSLDRSELRQSQLTALANRALHLLRSVHAGDDVNRLCDAGNPLGYLAKAWLTLTQGIEQVQDGGFDAFPLSNVRAALTEMENGPDDASWLLLRFKYDLRCVAEPYAFDVQLRLLDELEGAGYRMSHQLRLERAILLYYRNPNDANIEFQSLRRDLKQSDVIVRVPKRLQWLLANGKKERRLCDAIVVEDTGYRRRARVPDLKGALVPFIAQEFGERRMGTNQRFKCWITFGPMGPFIKRAPGEGGAGGRE